MSEVVFRAKVVGLHSNRHPPLGYEDSWKRGYEKDSVETESTLRVTEEENFRPLKEPKPTGKKGRTGTTIKGTKTSPWYRFVRASDGAIDRALIEDSLSRNIYGALRSVARLYDGRSWDFPNYRADAGTCRVEIKNRPKAKEQPTPVFVKLIGAAGGQWQYFENLEDLDVRVSVAVPVPTMALEEAITKLPHMRIGPTGRGHIESIEVGK